MGGWFSCRAPGGRRALVASVLAFSTSGLLVWGIHYPHLLWQIPLSIPTGVICWCTFVYFLRGLGKSLGDTTLDTYSKYSAWCVGGGLTLALLIILAVPPSDFALGLILLFLYGGFLGGEAFFALAGLRGAQLFWNPPTSMQ